MKTKTLLAALALTSASALSSAAIVDFDVTGTGTLVGVDSALVNSDYLYSGTATFNTDTFVVSFDLVQNISSLAGVADISSTGWFSVFNGVGESGVTGCSGAQAVCDSAPVTDPVTMAPYLATNICCGPNNPNMTWDNNIVVSTVLGDANSNSSFVATPSAVPVPAAAWLFGSALVGLASVGRKRSVV